MLRRAVGNLQVSWTGLHEASTALERDVRGFCQWDATEFLGYQLNRCTTGIVGSYRNVTKIDGCSGPIKFGAGSCSRELALGAERKGGLEAGRARDALNNVDESTELIGHCLKRLRG